jgi:hypothetical protein
MNRLIRLGIRQGWRRGILQGKRSWMVLGALAISARAMQQLGGRKEVVVYSERLESGGSLHISNLREDRRGQRAD